MYPNWGNPGSGFRPRIQPAGGSHVGQGPRFAGLEAQSGASMLTLQEQHLQQMQQLQMLHQKQLQSVLHHGNNAISYGAGPSGGYPGTSWHPEGPGYLNSSVGAPLYFQQNHTQPLKGPPAPQQCHQPPSSAPPQPSEPQLVPPLPEPPSLQPTEDNKKQSSTTEGNTSVQLQEKQQHWSQQHLQNQKLKPEKDKQDQKEGNNPVPPPQPNVEHRVPPPPSEHLKSIPPPPPPKEEAPAPPPPPEVPEVLKDSEEAVRLQKLEAAATQWQQAQQQKASLQYQALMQQHEKLQQLLEKYQQLIQEPAKLQSMPAEMQLRHYEIQQRQFNPLFHDWNHTFILWHGQFQTYHHKDQLQDYELQWKQWQEQMNATNAHLQERVGYFTAMASIASSQHSSGVVGQFGQYQYLQMQQLVKPDIQQSATAVCPISQGPRPSGFGPHSESHAGPLVRGIGPRPSGPPTVQPPSFDNGRGPRGNNPRFGQPQHRFDGPPRFDQPRHPFDGPLRFGQPFGQQLNFEKPGHATQPPHSEQPPAPQQKQPRSSKPEADLVTKQLDKISSKQLSDTEKTELKPVKKANNLDMTDDNLIGTEDFFVQNDPIPQTLQTNTKESDDNSASNNTDNSKPSESKPSGTASSATTTSAQTPLKPDGSLTNNKTSLVSKPPTIQELQASNQMQSRPDPPRPPPGRGRGQPPVPVQAFGRGRGHISNGDFRVSTTILPGNKIRDTSHECIAPEEDLEMPEEHQEQEDCYWQDTSYEEYGGEDLEMYSEEMWMSGEHHFPTEEEYYEEPIEAASAVGPRLPMGRGGPPLGRGGPPLGRGGPPMGRGGPPMGRGGPHMGRGGPHMGRGGPPMGRGGPPMGQGGPPMGRGGPPMGRGGPPMVRGGPPMGRGGPPMGRGGPPMGRGGPPMGRGGPPMGRGGPPMGRGGPPMGRGGPPMIRGGPPMIRGGPPAGRGGLPVGRGHPLMGRGGPPIRRGGPHPIGRGEQMDRHWEELDSVEYSEEEPYWGERLPPTRGMRPPFPPGRGRPPRGHPGFMHQGRGPPPHPSHGPMDHEPVHHEIGTEDAERDPARHPMYHEHDSQSHPMHPDVGRGRHHIPPPPNEITDPIEESFYDDGLEKKLGGQVSHGRGHPMAPHEIIDRGRMRGRPMGRGIARGMWRPGPAHQAYEEGYNEGYVEDYSLGEDGHRWQPPQDFPPEDYREDGKCYESEWDSGAPPEREYPPRMPPSEPYRDGHWVEERERIHPYPFDEHTRGRGELRIREYKDESQYPPPLPPSEFERSRLPPPPERGYPAAYDDHRTRYEERKEHPHLDGPPPLPPAAPLTKLPENSVDLAPQGSSGPNVLALSQYQHEIILKAAQELKFIREMKEGMTPATEPQRAPTDILPELPAGLLGVEIPPDVKNVLKGMTSGAQTAVNESVSLDMKPATTAPILKLIPKTVDYGHGHEPGATVERISYGERIVLRPDPVPLDRGYEKELLGPRDPYSRDPYYKRRSDPYMDRREYSRERDLYREKLPADYERERFERERFPPRERDERSPLAPSLRSGYRERDRDLREKEQSSSRDREEHYGRLGYDRPPYERIGPERFGHSTSPYMDRRSHPEERGPPTAPPLPPPPQPPPRVEKKPEIRNIDDILKPPGRLSRPERIVIIMRGLPGSGKSHVAKLIRDKEVDCGGAPPRVLVLDDYFMTEVEKVEKDPDTGRRVKTKVFEYEYEPEMEDTYRSSMLKTFKKTLDDGFFPFIILDTINDRVKHFDQFWSAAKTKGFEVYVAEITAETQTCAKRNVHGRTLKDIMKISDKWEPSPLHMVHLDVRSLLQDAAIEEVEMEDFNPDDEPNNLNGVEEETDDLGFIRKSKWEMDTSEAKLDKLDGLGGSGKRKREDMAGMDHFLQLPDDYATRTSEPGKKRVRWADLEEQKDADRKRAIGFVVGQTDWEKITDESGQLAQRALNRTKYF